MPPASKGPRAPKANARTAKATIGADRANRAVEAAHRFDNDQTIIVRGVALVSRILSRLFARVEIEGMGKVPRTGPVILAVNHISNGDPVVVGAWLTEALKRRRIHWLGKREIFDWPFIGWLAGHGGVHPVDRGNADVEAFRLASRILELGYVLLVFPEGTRSPDGTLQEAKDGLAMLAMRSNARIVPIGVNNTDAVWRKGQKLPSPFPRRTITVRIGQPFSLSDVVPADADRRTAKTLATRAIMGRIAELLDPRHRGVYADAIRTGPTPEP